MYRYHLCGWEEAYFENQHVHYKPCNNSRGSRITLEDDDLLGFFLPSYKKTKTSSLILFNKPDDLGDKQFSQFSTYPR